jgi:hypothetical protein
MIMAHAPDNVPKQGSGSPERGGEPLVSWMSAMPGDACEAKVVHLAGSLLLDSHRKAICCKIVQPRDLYHAKPLWMVELKVNTWRTHPFQHGVTQS